MQQAPQLGRQVRMGSAWDLPLPGVVLQGVVMFELKYLAYGSNLHPPRLRERVPSAEPLGVVSLPGWSLRFHKRGEDGSGKCNLVYTGQEAESAFGVVYRIDAREKVRLDRAEGLGLGYREHSLELAGHGRVFFYLAMEGHVDDSLQPFDWYKAFVLAGAEYHGLPRDYCHLIESVPHEPDPDVERTLAARSILLRNPD